MRTAEQRANEGAVVAVACFVLLASIFGAAGIGYGLGLVVTWVTR